MRGCSIVPPYFLRAAGGLAAPVVGRSEVRMLRIYPVVLELIRDVRPFVDALERRDVDLARQCRRALCSIPLNLSEGALSQGKNRRARYFNALGSARESLTCFETAYAFGYLEPLPAATAGQRCSSASQPSTRRHRRARPRGAAGSPSPSGDERVARLVAPKQRAPLGPAEDGALRTKNPTRRVPPARRGRGFGFVVAASCSALLPPHIDVFPVAGRASDPRRFG